MACTVAVCVCVCCGISTQQLRQVARPLFVQPEERIMTLGNFCGALEDAQPTDEVLPAA